jgi:hypothetical protein
MPPPAATPDAAKTMMAVGPNPLAGLVPPPTVPARNGPMMPQPVPSHTPQGSPQMLDAGNPKTVLLNPSDGIVSMAGPNAAQGKPAVAADDDEGGGPSVLFWILCIVFGVGIGIGAFMLISRLAV